MKKSFYNANQVQIKNKKWDHLLLDLPNEPLAPQYSKNNLPILKYQGSYIHSAYDPVKEAKRFVHVGEGDNATLVLIIGLGYGYHISEVINQLGDKPCLIFIFEWTKEIFYSALHYADLSFLSDRRVILFVGEKCLDSFQSILLSLKIADIKGSYVLHLQSEYSLFKKEYDELIYQINYLIKQQFQNQLTSYEFERLWLKNLIINTSHLVKHDDLSLLFNKFQSITALVVSAGPSLSHSMKEINKYKEKLFIIATDTALTPLLEGGILPDFIVTVDAQFYNFKDFLTFGNNKSTILLYDLMVYHKIPKLVQGRQFYFTSVHLNGRAHPLINMIQSQFNTKITTIQTGSSVGSTAIEIARLLGFNPIILIGQDLSYPYLMTHSASSPTYNHFFYQTDRLVSLESLFYKRIHSRKVITLSEKPILKTDFVLKNLNDWLGDYASIYQVNKQNKFPLLLNATQTGFPIKNIPNISLDKDFEKYNEFLLSHEEKNNKMDQIFLIQSENLYNFKELEHFYKNMNHALTRFINLLLKELENPNINVSNITLVKRNLVLEYSFLNHIFQREDLWYFRKKQVQEEDKHLYTNMLLKATQFVIKYLRTYCFS